MNGEEPKMNAGSVREVELQKLVTVDDQTYKLVLFMPSRAFKLGARVAKFMGEPAVAMAAAAGDENKAIEALPIAIRALLNNLDEDQVWGLIKELMTCVSQNNQMVDVDLQFRGQLGHLIKVVAKVVEYQFQDFFGAIGKAIAEVMGKTAA
jgi:hypothetical protein